MDVSTRPAQSKSSFGAGAALAARHALWFVPLLLPVAVLQSLLVVAPWFDSMEAAAQGSLVTSTADWHAREVLSLALVACGGVPGFATLSVLVTLSWLVVLRAHGPLRSPRGARPAAPVASHREHAAMLAAWLAGAGACLFVQSSASGLDRLVDSVTSLRPTGAASLGLLAASQAGSFAAIAAILGATLALSRCVGSPAARLGALTVILGVAAGAITANVAGAAVVARRFDTRGSLADALGSPRKPEPVTIIVLARDRAWLLPMHDGLAGVRFSAESAARAESLLEARQGWSFLASDAQRFVVSERLMAFDPDGARGAALRSALRLGASTSAQALLAALTSIAPTVAARRDLDALENAPALRLGPEALHLIAVAHARLGDRARAERAVGRMRGGESEAWVRASRNAKPLKLPGLLHGSVTGRLTVDGSPWRGRVGLVATRDLFSLPEAGSEVQPTWLLRLLAAAPVDAEGRFSFSGLPDGELALVLLMRGRPLHPVVAGAPLPRLEVTVASPAIDTGDIAVSTGRLEAAGKPG